MNETPDDATGVPWFDVIEARYVGGHSIWIRFENGTDGTIDLSSELFGPIFLPLRDVSYFAQMRVNPETGTVEWPNGADFAPEFLYEKISRPSF